MLVYYEVEYAGVRWSMLVHGGVSWCTMRWSMLVYYEVEYAGVRWSMLVHGGVSWCTMRWSMLNPTQRLPCSEGETLTCHLMISHAHFRKVEQLPLLCIEI